MLTARNTIGLRVLDLPRSASTDRRYYVVAEVDGQQHRTKVSEKRSALKWEETLTLYVQG